MSVVALPRDAMPRADTTHIVVLASGTQPHVDIGARDLARWFEGSSSPAKCPYHYVIRRNGECEAGRPITMRGHGHQGFNAVALWVCLVGGLNPDYWDRQGDFFEDVQKQSLHRLLVELRNRYPDAKVLGHGDLPGGLKRKNPGFSVQGFMVDVGLITYKWW